MNPNKKMLNPKNTSPWLLCASKRFPGKMYNFNVLTGETAWCPSETDENLTADTIHRVMDKTHNYPEPFDLPIDDSTNPKKSYTPLKNAGNTEFSYNAKITRPSPVFGQAVFPKYVSSEIFASPKFVWTLTMTPTYVQMLDQATQTSQPIFVPNVRPMFDRTPKLNCFNLPKEAHTLAKSPKKDEACQIFESIRAKRFRTDTESESFPEPALKPSRYEENLTTLFTRDVETSTINSLHKVDNETGKLSELDKNDLRFKLVAKKRKLECATETEKKVKSADQSTSKPREVLTPKKIVTFDIQESASDSSDDVQETDQSPEPPRMVELSQPTPGGPWYVVADTTALLKGWQCIEDFVKSDPRCRLLVPHAVHTELEGRSRGDSGATVARQLMRKLAAHVSHIVVQINPEHELSSEDSILRCCWTLLQENIYVVLISNNTNMLSKAKSIDLECYTLDQIKNDNQTTAEPQNDPVKPKIIEEYYKNNSKNLFMQDLSEVSGLRLPNPNGFRVCESGNNILETGTDTGSQFCKRDANSDKLIDLTRPRVITVFNSGMTNVIDQITKLSIAGNASLNNRSTQIMKNLFRTTVLSKIDQDTPTADMENYNSNQNLIDKNKSDINNKNVRRKLEIIDKTDRDIRRLNETENNKEKSRDIIKVSGITKLNNQFNLDECLERFDIKNAVVENRVKSRFDEWVCRLNQTMEGVLTEILQEERNQTKRMMPPWNLFEAIQVTRETFKNQPFLKTIIDRFSLKLLDCSNNTGKLNKDVKPNDLMTLIGLSMMLIEHLKEIVNSKVLYEAEDMLVDLIKNIEDPESDIDLSLKKVNTPMSQISGSEISDVKAPVGFRKSRKEIVEYLKKHFAAWQTFETVNLTNANDKTINKEANIVITCGKDLNTLKINNSKAITVENKAADKADVVNQPKVIRNVKIIPAFEERLINKAVDINQHDYEENVTVYTVPPDADVKLNDGNDKTNHLSDCFLLDDLSVSASSSVNTECARAYPLVKIFLGMLKSTLIKIFDFINKTIQECQEGISMDKKADMLMKTQLARQYLLKTSERLKNIIARESSDGTTLKDLLTKAGDYVEEDLIMTNYRQTVTKFLEQTQILEEIVELVLSLLNATTSKEEPRSDSLAASPILPTRRLRSNVQLTNGG